MMMLFGRIDRTSTSFEEIAAEIRSRGGAVRAAAADQIIASWPANGAGPDHAVNACRAALALRRMSRTARIGTAPAGQLHVRLAIDCGERTRTAGDAAAGSDQAAADFLIAAKRLDLANACFGTEIAIGERARSLAGERIHVRELDPPAEAGWPTDRIYELLGTADRGGAPSWLSLYQAGLAAYRSRDFAGALGFFQMVLALRQWDPPSHAMVGRCRAMLATASQA
jgi:adenylate cyclase